MYIYKQNVIKLKYKGKQFRTLFYEFILFGVYVHFLNIKQTYLNYGQRTKSVEIHMDFKHLRKIKKIKLLLSCNVVFHFPQLPIYFN